jgi:hypothetical protein
VLVFKRASKDAGSMASAVASSGSNPGDPVGRADNAPEGKGKATPKRSQAEAARKTSVVGGGGGRGGSRGAAAGRGRSPRLTPEQSRMRREAMRRGDDSALTARDRGPARRLARDYVDSRRSVVGLFIPIALPVILLGYSRVPILTLVANFGLYAFVLGSIVDSVLMTRGIRKQVAQRYPNESTKGLGLYAVMRAMQFRRLRMPGPRVARGGKV